jgi:uncharacterized protein
LIGYIAVHDVDAHIEKIVKAGGKLWKPATDVPGMLRFAACPTLRVPRLWSLLPIRNAFAGTPRTSNSGSIGWHELQTTTSKLE